MNRRGGRIPCLRRRGGGAAGAAVAALLLGAGELPGQCTTTPIVAKVVAIEQQVWYNRLGAHEPEQLMYVLEQDLVSSSGGTPSHGNHKLRPGKRPRPLTLRVNAGSCLQIQFRNWLSPGSGGLGTPNASVHVMGMQLVQSILDDGSNVGQGQNSLVPPGQSRTYTLFAEREGTFLMYSTAQTTGADGDGGQIGKGLFGAVNVEPRGAEWYRSQLTRAELDLASTLSGSGYPAINYDAVYPNGHPMAGRPILRMVQNGVIVHGDLNAIITGPGRGNFPASSFPNPGVPVYNESDSRLRPFREFTVIFHDEVGLVQAFDSIFNDPMLEYTLHGARDAFAINYGTGGIGAEILANRFEVGPMGECNECKFEEFFLSSWVVGDPAMVVDNPTGIGFHPGSPAPPATLVRYPDDPSNVFHSYLNDHVKIRNLHAGPKEHHVFHLHAHQWLHTPESGNSNYLDSQAIGPGGGYTYEITYGGSGNRNETPGDAILHCHFYPHFAQGMWGLWRVHDVFERGTVLDDDGRPAAGSRALPDGEIATGTPIPAVVPLPTYAMAPLPTSTMPGFPFYIPGVPGHRPPKPPLDTQFDGGLPRHVVTGGTATFPMPLDTKDFHKHDSTLAVVYLPEAGTPLEQAAMQFHSQSFLNTPIAGSPSSSGQFRLNGLTPKPGAPYADPCGVGGQQRGTPFTVKGAAFQLTASYNKADWRFNQHRMFSLWGDVASYLDPVNPRAPEPMFFRAHDNSCITYHLVNLIPEEYAPNADDDFQVRTPTDVIGQHIHLVKFDVTSSDGASNGFNYEDGSFSPGDVRHRIEAIRRFYGCDVAEHENCPGDALPHPYFGPGPGGEWVGAQETVQRWWVDPVLRPVGTSPLGAVFTHDHFGPSTHQQAGLYAALIPEERGTRWRDPETGQLFGGRFDGGPTSWRADILYPDPDSSFREFNLQVADFTLAYGKEGFDHPSPPYLPPINPPGKDEVGLPDLLRPPLARNNGPPGLCPNGIDLPPCPEIISADDPGTMVVNYRNEPIAMRVRTPGHRPTGNHQAPGLAGDLSSAFSSNVVRSDPRFNTFGPYGARPGVLATDPFTPLMRVYEDDRIRMNLLVGAHEEGHNVNVRGTRWLFEPLDHESGWRNSQAAMISEFHNFRLTPLIGNPEAKAVDFLYESAATDDRWNGTWGLLRMYRTEQKTLCLLHDYSCSGISSDPGLEQQGALARGEDTGEPVSLSLRAALAARLDGERPVVDGFRQLEVNAPLPDPADSTTWSGDLATLRSAEAADPRHASVSPSFTAEGMTAMNVPGWTSADSAQGGFGNQPLGGFDYDQFEWDPVNGEARVTTSVAPPGQFGFTYQGTLNYIQQPPGMPGEYEMAGDKWTSNSYTAGFDGVCPTIAPVRYYDITAIDAKTQLPGGRLVYNSRGAHGGPLVDTAAILYVFTADLTYNLLTEQPDPLVLRANAGECILVRLRNGLNLPLLDPAGWNTLPPIVDLFNSNDVAPSERVGLHPQLVAYDVALSDGSEVGINDDTTVPPGAWRWYTWYAGDIRTAGGILFRATPIEFGATNLMSSDPIEHASKGAIGALVVEPRRSTHHMDPGRRVMATIKRPDGSSFRELVLLWQDDLNLQFGSETKLQRFDCEIPYDSDEEAEHCETTGGSGMVVFQAGEPVPNLAESEDPEDSGQKAFDYRTEPLWLRMGFAPNAELGLTRTFDFTHSLTHAQVGGPPETPLLQAEPGSEVRVRILQSGGHARNHVFNLHGHVWEELPYVDESLGLGSNPLSEWKGGRDLHGPGNHHDVIVANGAGGRFKVPGFYLYRDQASFQFDGGLWGLLHVVDGAIVGGTGGGAGLMGGSCTIDAATGETVCSR